MRNFHWSALNITPLCQNPQVDNPSHKQAGGRDVKQQGQFPSSLDLALSSLELYMFFSCASMMRAIVWRFIWLLLRQRSRPRVLDTWKINKFSRAFTALLGKYEQHILRCQKLKFTDVRILVNRTRLSENDPIEGNRVYIMVTHWNRVLLLRILC